jgi:transmembrane sensor
MGRPLGEVVRVLQRWQNGKIMIIGEELKSRPVTLVVDLERLKDVLPVLARVLSINVHRFTDYLTVIRAA